MALVTCLFVTWGHRRPNVIIIRERECAVERAGVARVMSFMSL